MDDEIEIGEFDFRHDRWGPGEDHFGEQFGSRVQ